MINKQTFFENIRPLLFTNLTQLQVDSINGLFDEIEAQNVTDLKHIAYVFATAYHEAMNVKTGERIVPISEYGGEKYLKSKKYYPYYGRGFVQITWFDNYERFTKILFSLFLLVSLI
mgnify:CR=1 FL=1